MTRSEPKTSPFLYIAIGLSVTGTFVADLLTPLGIAVWITYLVPIVLSLFAWRKMLPLLVAVLATIFIFISYMTDTPGMDRDIARANRTFGVLTIWIMAVVGYYTVHNKIAVRRQEWLQSAQTGLSEKMGGDPGLEQLGDNVLRYLCEYLDAHVGAIFLEDSGSYRRFAAYGVPAQNDMPVRFSPGDGLLGQAVKDNRSILIRDVPEGYITIGSALGQSKPRSLLISPAEVDGQINAVLELGFLHSTYESDMELLERVSESIAVAVRSARYRERLQDLLEETQRQAEELQAQAEELRVSNEELEEQSRALQESQARLELQQAELEQTNTQLEEQAQHLEAQRDELRRAKSSLERQTDELAEASRYKSEFLANMSHELRTPLNSSLILAKLLADNPDNNLTGEQVRYAQTIQSAGNDLLTLINDILDLSKIEAGRMEIQAETLPLSRLFQNLEQIFQPVASQKGIVFRTAVQSGAPNMLETDPQKLEQILRNLLSNAIKFTDTGEVVLEAAAAPEGRIALSVRDTGIGIAESQQQIIFEAFRQADGTTNRKYGGTGLGLSISRELARLLGGDISLESEPSKGSTFTIILPQAYDAAVVPGTISTASHVVIERPRLAPATSAPAPALRPDPPAPATPVAAAPIARSARIEDDRERLRGNGRVVLVVEDDASFAHILYDLAQEFEFQCLVATTAEEGLALAIQFVPSAVLLDVGLPDNSGLSVLDRLKSDARTRHIPVHVISAEDYSQTALSLGAVGYMLKPVKHEELVQAFDRLETRLTQKMRRVLVVEDDEVQLESLQRLLGSKDVETLGARSVEQCLEMLQSSTFDCMVMDLSLPDASGFSLLETLSREDHYAFPPVIVYTGRDLSSAEELQLRKYAKSIIIKGAKSPERLLDEVTLFLHQVVSDLPAEQQRMLEKARSRDSALEGRRILVVEDDVRNVFALTSILEPRGAIVQIARNGREALTALDSAQKSPSSSIDLILMDIMMPEMDGFTAMREIRKRPDGKSIPVIALTAKAMKNDQEQCLAAGANDYMSKPLDVEKLLSLVRVWMPR